MVDQALEELSPSIAAVVLAAGDSRRLGRPKQLLTIDGETLLERAVRTALRAGLRPLLPVLNAMLGADAALLHKLSSMGARSLVNDEAQEGMAASVRCGIGELGAGAVRGAVLMTCDQIAVTAEHLRQLCAQPLKTAASGYAGRVGTPAYFPAQRFPELLALKGEQGARGLLGRARVVTTEALALDVDTEQQWAEAQDWLRQNWRR